MKILATGFLCASIFINVAEAKENSIIQVEVVSEQSSNTLETKVNKFLLEKKITRESLVEIKFSRCLEYKTALIVYEVEIEKKK